MNNPQKTVLGLQQRLRLDTETISATIRWALHFGAGRPTPGELAEAEGLLRGHIAVLLTEVREEAPDQKNPSGAEVCQMTSRLKAIGRQMAEGLGDSPLAAHVKVRHLARDCQWLLAHYTARAGW